MSAWVPLVVIGGVVALWWFTRVGELFYLSVRDGRILVVRGRIPASLLQDIARTVVGPVVSRASIRALKTERGGRLVFGGRMDEGQRQQARNIFALYPMSQLRKAPAIRRPTLGQLLGIGWLAWLLTGC